VEAARHLVALPDPETGELVEVTPEALEDRIVRLEDELAEAHRLIRSQAYRIGVLTRDHQAEAESSPHWPIAVRLFEYHNRLLGHPGAEWNLKRFAMVRRELKKKNGLERCLRAIAGKANDDWARTHGHTTFDDVFESAKKFEKCLAKCPVDWQPPESAKAFL